jgi:hypothetical protein
MFSRGYNSQIYDDEIEDAVAVPSFTNLAGMGTLLFFFALLIEYRTRKYKVHMLI